MSVPESLVSLVGHWSGTYKLWLDPSAPERECASTAQVECVGGDRFLSLRYTWSFDGKPQEGLLLLGHQKEGAVQAPWIDSWHNGDRIMVCAGIVDAEGALDVKGTYPAPPGPDWGWTTKLTGGGGELRIVQHNVEPDGTASLAVELVLRRR